jgi:hypothetical protein
MTCEASFVSAEVTARVLNYLLADLAPHLPPDVGIKVTPYAKWTTVQRADAGSQDIHGIQTKITRDGDGRPVSGTGRGASVRKLAPSLPFIPRGVRRQIAAKTALGILLDLAYPKSHTDGFSRSTDYSVLTQDTRSGVTVSYQLPGSDARVALKPLPRELFE